MMLTLTAILEKETKGALRYQEIDEQGHAVKIETAKVGTLYLRKAALNGEHPAAIAITITEGK